MIVIRKMEERDAEAVIGMMRGFYASPAVHTDGSEEIFARDVAECVGESPFLCGYVFEDGGVIAGYAMAAHSFSTEYGRPCVWLEDLYVEPDYRGRGIGTRLIRTLAAEHPDSVIRLEAERENERAVGVYRKEGFCEMPYLELIRMPRDGGTSLKGETE